MKTYVIRPRPRRGFTLLELLIVVVLGGVVTAMSVGRIHSLTVQQRLHRAVAATQNDIEAAFAISVRNRQPVRISWDASKLQLDVTDRAGTTYFRKSNLGKEYGLTAAAVTFSRSPIEIYPNGLANDALTITLKVESDSALLRMSRSGMIQVP